MSFTTAIQKICRGSWEADWEKLWSLLQSQESEHLDEGHKQYEHLLQTLERSLFQMTLLCSRGICIMLMKHNFMKDQASMFPLSKDV